MAQLAPTSFTRPTRAPCSSTTHWPGLNPLVRFPGPGVTSPFQLSGARATTQAAVKVRSCPVSWSSSRDRSRAFSSVARSPARAAPPELGHLLLQGPVLLLQGLDPLEIVPALAEFVRNQGKKARKGP